MRFSLGCGSRSAVLLPLLLVAPLLVAPRQASAASADGYFWGYVRSNPTGAAISDICVDVYAYSTFTPVDQLPVTDSAGKWSSRDLPPGSYTVHYDACNNPNWDQEWYHNAVDWEHATYLEIGPGGGPVQIDEGLQPTGQHTLTVMKSGSGTGTVTSNPAGINCGGTCWASFSNGTNVTLSATPASGSTFAGWGGACSGPSTTCPVSMTSAKTATAIFNPAGSGTTLTVSKSGTGTGRVTSSPAGIDCGSACSAPFASGTSVTLTAAPDSGSTFSGWNGGGCTGNNATCTVAMTASHNIVATFNTPSTRTLTVTRSGDGNGSVTSSPSGIDCGTTCSAGFAHGTSVTLTATSPDDSYLESWSGGGCSGNAATCVVTMNSDLTVTATFRQVTNPQGICDDPGVICGGPGPDRLTGGPEENLILGYGGNDVCRGGGGNDIIRCAAGNDLLFGGGGNDLLVGGSGSDRLSGGSGTDRCVGNRRDEPRSCEGF